MTDTAGVGGASAPVDFDALVERATAVLSPGALDFALAGAGAERSLRGDIEAWDNIGLRPHVLSGLSHVDTSCDVLGAAASNPIVVAPTGGHGLFHPEAEAATARGAAQAGSIMTLSAYSNISLEEVAAAAPDSPRWFQLPHELPRDRLGELIDRAAAARYRAVVLTVDQVVMGYSPTGSKRATELPQDLVLANLPGQPVFVTGYHPRRGAMRPIRQSVDDVRWLVDRSPLPMVVKGVLRGDDARRCVDAGVKGIVVSNHGGRHLDRTVPPARALAEVVSAVAGRVSVLVDGGIRRGDHVLKAIAFGADAVMVGRAPLLGLAVAGSDGVAAVIRQLNEELVRAMALCGAGDLASVEKDLIAV
ncbi:alpha-hydroxy acid oxidase [Micromonospora sp. NPDC005299]|uniref:alpha-hydroxy acid oxidase n=1 Tax=Micromonospora sp. NPDC005299 TaxID=3364231 RepID=UPI0036862BAA